MVPLQWKTNEHTGLRRSGFLNRSLRATKLSNSTCWSTTVWCVKERPTTLPRPRFMMSLENIRLSRTSSSACTKTRFVRRRSPSGAISRAFPFIRYKIGIGEIDYPGHRYTQRFQRERERERIIPCFLLSFLSCLFRSLPALVSMAAEKSSPNSKSPSARGCLVSALLAPCWCWVIRVQN